MQPNFGVLFDMDGVIVHSNPAHKKAIQAFCNKYNQDVSQDFLENRLYGRMNKEWIPELFGPVSNDRLRALADEKEQMFRDAFAPEHFAVKGIIPFLEHLKTENIPMVVATSAPKDNADYILSRLSIYDYFEAVLHSAHVTNGKPHPEPYLNAANAINMDAQRCIVIEDSLSGVKSGLNAGAKVIGVTTTHSAQELSNCHLIIENFDGLTSNDLQLLFRQDDQTQTNS